MLVESVIAVLAWRAWQVAGKRGVMTPERAEMYDAAMAELRDSGKLRQLADAFDRDGCREQAATLRKRADLHDMPQEKKQAYREAVDRALKSENVDGVLRLADAFDTLTATGSAAKLRAHAAELRQRQVGYSGPYDRAPTAKAEEKVEIVDAKVEPVKEASP